MLTQERIDQLGDNFYNLFYNETHKTEKGALSLIDQMFNNLVALNPEWTQDEQNEVFKQIFRPLQNDVYQAFRWGE